MPSAADEPGSHLAWLRRLSPWPADGFGLDRMHALLELLGSPQLEYEAVHVVGTNGKTTATKTIEALLVADGLHAGATISPHVRSWSERITVDGREVDLEWAFARVRTEAERVGATQFEAVTAAALAAFADARVDAAVVEAGLGGRLDATNVLRSRVVLLTNVSEEHTDVLGETPEEIAREKLAVVHQESIVVLSDNRYAHLLPDDATLVIGGAREAAEAFAGHPIDAAPALAVPGRLEERADAGEVRDGAHNPAGARWLADRLRPRRFVLCVSVLRDKDVDGILGPLAELGDTIVATTSSSARALPAAELADHARPRFAHVEAVDDPHEALARAHALGAPVLVTGSLYLLAELEGG